MRVSLGGGSLLEREVGTVCGNECHILGLARSLLGQTRWPGVESRGWETGKASWLGLTAWTHTEDEGHCLGSLEEVLSSVAFQKVTDSDRRLDPGGWHPG